MRTRRSKTLRNLTRALLIAAGAVVASPLPVAACGLPGFYDAAVDRWVPLGPCRDKFFWPGICEDGRNVSLLYFAQGETQLAEDLQYAIDALVARRALWNEQMTGMAPFGFQLFGYADVSEVDGPLDKTMSAKRAAAVRDALISAGVPAELISVTSLAGDAHCPRDSAAGRSGNRLVEVWIVFVDKRTLR